MVDDTEVTEVVLEVIPEKGRAEAKGKDENPATLSTKQSETGTRTGPHLQTKMISLVMRRSNESDGGLISDTSLHSELIPLVTRRNSDR